GVNGIVLPLGGVVGVSIVGTVIYLLADAGDVSSGGSGSDTSYWLKLVVGVLLVPLAFRHWRKRPAAGEEVAPPKWLSSIDTLTPLKTGGLAVRAAAPEPKKPPPALPARPRLRP